MDLQTFYKSFDLDKSSPSEYKITKEQRNETIKNMIKQPEEDISVLAKAFFSDRNIDLINKKLVLTIFREKKLKVPFQKTQDMMTIMRFVWDRSARHLPYNIKEQIRELDDMVVCEIKNYVICEAEQEIEYLRTINSEREINHLPINVNHLNKTLPALSSVYFN